MNYPNHPAADTFPMLDKTRYAELLEDMRTNGQRLPIILCDDQILDGRNRMKACLELNLQPKFETFTGNPWDLVWSLNGTRRDIPDLTRALIRKRIIEKSTDWLKQQEEIKKKANEKRSESAKGNVNAVKEKDEKTVLVQCEQVLFSDESKRAPSRAAKAKEANVSPSTMGKAEWLDNNRPDLADKVIKGEMKPTDAIREMKRDEIKEKLESIEAVEAKAVSGLFDVIVIDPPWPMQKIERDVAPNQVSNLDYPVMSLAEIGDMTIPCASDCHLFMWTTHKFLPDSFDILKKWGFNYVCCFVWHKPGGFQPYGLPQFNCEFCLYCRKGTPSFMDTKAFSVCFDAPRGKHSEKPEAFYDVVRRVTAGRRLDMFNRRTIEGFEVWGNEA